MSTAETHAYTIELVDTEVQELQRVLDKLATFVIDTGNRPDIEAAVAGAIDKFGLLSGGTITATAGQWHAVAFALNHAHPLGIGAGPDAISLQKKIYDEEHKLALELGELEFTAALKAEAEALMANTTEPAEVA